ESAPDDGGGGEAAAHEASYRFPGIRLRRSYCRSEPAGQRFLRRRAAVAAAGTFGRNRLIRTLVGFTALVEVDMSPRCARVLAVIASTWLSLSRTSAQTFEVLHEFWHSGENPTTPVLAASDGNLYVTAFGGGDLRKGSIYKLTPNGTGGY